ncbi:hypothetical protein DFH11DRAFT_1110002 [Phellopilus nigrolimitatus]|nr:hypothetical protein DFH11DRAFT_1110002 [Phellopilus nigrolimitatus]
MKLDEFPADVLLKILSFCRVVDVLKIEMMSKRLQDIISVRSVWLYFLRNADLEHAPQISPSMSADALADAELRDHVVRAVRGHYNWSSVNPHVTSTIRIEVGGMPTLLRVPSGRRHLIGYLQRGGGHIHCWNVSGEKQGQSIKYAWQAPKRELPISMTCQYINDRTSLVVAYCALLTATQLLIEVVEFDLHRNLAEVRCTKTVPVKNTLKSRVNKICMRGPFVVVATTKHFIFVNWETGVMAFAAVPASMFIFSVKIFDGSLLFMAIQAGPIAVHSDLKLATASLSDIFSQATPGKATMPNIDVFFSATTTIDMSITTSHFADRKLTLRAVTLHGAYVPSSIPGSYSGKDELVDTISVLSTVPQSSQFTTSGGSCLIAHIICLVRDKETRSLSFIQNSCSRPYQLPIDSRNVRTRISKSGRILYWSRGHSELDYHALTLASLWSGNQGGLLQSKRTSDRSRITGISLDYNSGATIATDSDTKKGFVLLEYYD